MTVQKSFFMKSRFLPTVLMLSYVCATATDNARFSYFQYQGKDAYYDENPLAASGEYFNPVIAGWASDPSLCRTGDDYWLVTSTFGYFPGVPLYHSRDLITWEHVGNVLSRQSQLPWLEGLSLDKGGVYAPSITYNPCDSTYYMITTCVMAGKDGHTKNFYVTARNPLEEWSEPVVLDDVEGIDPSFFFDTDDRAYIVYKSDERNPVKWSNYRALSIVEFDTAAGHTVGKPVRFREEGVGPEERLERNEGPHIYKIDGKYYLLAAEGGTGSLHSEVCYRADSVMGPYWRWSRNPMLTQRLLKPTRKHPVTSTGHVDMVDTPDGQWYAVFLGCRPWNDGYDHLGRETYLMPVKWSADGFPYITQNIDTVPSRATIAGAPGRQSAVNAGNFTWRDDFSSAVPRPEWMSLWGSASDYSTIGDGLVLAAAPIDTRSRVTPALLVRRMQHHKFDVETEVVFDPKEEAAAGLILVKNEQRQLLLAVMKDEIALMRVAKDRYERLSSAGADTGKGAIGLRVESTGSSYRFFYRLPGESSWRPLPVDVETEYISTQRGGFTGTTVGVFASSAPLLPAQSASNPKIR